MEMVSCLFAYALEQGKVGIVSVERVKSVEAERGGVLVELLGEKLFFAIS